MAWGTANNKHKVFKITPGGVISEIIDVTGDGMGNQLADPFSIAASPGGSVYIAGVTTHNAFEITLPSATLPALSELGLAALTAALLAAGWGL